MNEEKNRLQTFSEWPSDSVVSPQRIAKAGFYSTRQGLEVQCFACHTKISSWNYGDQVMARHKLLSPHCPFVVNPSISGNVPCIAPAVQGETSVSTNLPDYKSEATRLASFENWPIPNIVTPERLAGAGFYYLKDGDNTKCAYCKGVVRAWEMGDDPDFEHKRYFPSCPFVISTIAPRISSTGSEATRFDNNKTTFSNMNIVGSVVDGDLDELGVQKHNGPKRSDFANVETRLRTFVAWSPDLIQTPEILAQAGFYYEGVADQVRCFHCDGGLKHWDPDDDPWTEHARWFPRCSFVKLVKGQEFVVACALDHTQSTDQPNDKVQATRRKREVSERELQDHMVSAPALAALSIGINVERVKRAIKEKLETTGKAYSQPDALVEAALNMQLEEDDGFDSETPQNTQIRNAVTSVLSDMVKRTDNGCNANSNQPQSTLQVYASPAGTADPHSISNLQKSVSLEEENRLLKEARLCKICMDGEVGIVFLPCGHLTTCVNCAPNLEDCPVCRCAIKATVRTFLS